MWVSTEFFMAVVQCFTHVVNGDIEQAVAVAATVTRDEVQQCMDMQRPGARLSKLVRKYDTQVACVTDLLAKCSGYTKTANSPDKTTREIREQFTLSLRAVLADAFKSAKDNTDDCTLLAAMISDHEMAKRMVVEKERFWARTAATLNKAAR